MGVNAGVPEVFNDNDIVMSRFILEFIFLNICGISWMDANLCSFMLIVSLYLFCDGDPFTKTRRDCCGRMVVGFTTTYLYNQCQSPLQLWVRTPFMARQLETTVCNKVCQRIGTGRWFSPDIPVSSTNKTGRYDITEILLKVAINTITLTANDLRWGMILWFVDIGRMFLFIIRSSFTTRMDSLLMGPVQRVAIRTYKTTHVKHTMTEEIK